MGSSMDSGREWTEQDANNPKHLQAVTQVARLEQQTDRLVQSFRDKDRNIQLHVGPGMFVLSEKEALSVIQSLAHTLRS